jgi:hypothetical protein
MPITPATLTRAAGLSAVAAGLLFIGVQIGHPHLDATFVTTTEWAIRQSVKIVMAVLSLAGITGMYLHQVKRVGILGLAGYLLFSAGYLIMISVEVAGLVILPALAGREPGYVNDVLAVATGGQANGDIGRMLPLIIASAVTFLGGGLIFGIALFRARVLARWAAALLSAGAVSTLAIPLLPQINERVFAIPTSIALIGLGYSLWRDQRATAAAAATGAVVPSASTSQFGLADTR